MKEKSFPARFYYYLPLSPRRPVRLDLFQVRRRSSPWPTATIYIIIIIYTFYGESRKTRGNLLFQRALLKNKRNRRRWRNFFLFFFTSPPSTTAPSLTFLEIRRGSRTVGEACDVANLKRLTSSTGFRRFSLFRLLSVRSFISSLSLFDLVNTLVSYCSPFNFS